MRKIIFFTLIISSHCLSQKDSLSNWRYGLSKYIGEIGYLYQKEHLLEFGLKFECIRVKGGRRYDRIIGIPSLKSWQEGAGASLIFGGQITKRNDLTYLNPYITARFMFFSFVYRPVICCTYSYRNIGGNELNTLTPEIGLNFSSILNITYGYNIFIGDTYNWISKHRLGIRIMIH